MTIELADKTVRDTFSAGFEHLATVVVVFSFLATVVVVFSFFATVVFGIFIIDVEEGFESLGRDEPELLGAVLPHAARLKHSPATAIVLMSLITP